MKYIPLLALGLALTPALAVAQTPPAGAPPEGPPAMTTQQRAAMEQVHTQMRTLHQQARNQILGSLTPAHRALLATTVGQLAVAANPNAEAAASQLDAALSPAEKQAIVNAETSFHNNERSLMESARAQMEANASPDDKAKMQERDAHMQQMMATRQPKAIDPGRTLLRLSEVGGRGDMHGDMHGPH